MFQGIVIIIILGCQNLALTFPCGNTIHATKPCPNMLELATVTPLLQQSALRFQMIKKNTP